MNILTKKRFLILFLILSLFFIVNVFFKDQFKNIFYSFSENIQIFLWEKGTDKYFSQKDQEKLNKDLVIENQKLLSSLVLLEEIKSENNFLRESLSLGEYEGISSIYGKIITKDFLSDSILINIGASDGAKKGFPVVISENLLLGKIIEVYPSYSRVMLLSSKDNLIDVIVDDKVSLVRGKGDGEIILEMFPREIELKEDILITTSSIGGTYPSGLLIGKVKNSKKIDNESFQGASIDVPFDLNLLTRVFVLKFNPIFND
jgi:rod shape-determining protein MreC